MATLTRSVKPWITTILENNVDKVSKTKPNEPYGGQPKWKINWQHDGGSRQPMDHAIGDDQDDEEWGICPTTTTLQNKLFPINFIPDESTNAK